MNYLPRIMWWITRGSRARSSTALDWVIAKSVVVSRGQAGYLLFVQILVQDIVVERKAELFPLLSESIRVEGKRIPKISATSWSTTVPIFISSMIDSLFKPQHLATSFKAMATVPVPSRLGHGWNPYLYAMGGLRRSELWSSPDLIGDRQLPVAEG